MNACSRVGRDKRGERVVVGVEKNSSSGSLDPTPREPNRIPPRAESTRSALRFCGFAGPIEGTEGWEVVAGAERRPLLTMSFVAVPQIDAHGPGVRRSSEPTCRCLRAGAQHSRRALYQIAERHLLPGGTAAAGLFACLRIALRILPSYPKSTIDGGLL